MVTIETPNPPADQAAHKRRKRKRSLDRFSWHFMRDSGVVLVILISGHLISNLIVGEGIRAIDFGFVGGKLANPFWQWWDVLLLWLALMHGTFGMRTIINDYVTRVWLNRGLLTLLFAASTCLIILGTLVVFTFDPCPATSNPDLLPSFCATVSQ